MIQFQKCFLLFIFLFLVISASCQSLEGRQKRAAKPNTEKFFFLNLGGFYASQNVKKDRFGGSTFFASYISPVHLAFERTVIKKYKRQNVRRELRNELGTIKLRSHRLGMFLGKKENLFYEPNRTLPVRGYESDFLKIKYSYLSGYSLVREEKRQLFLSLMLNSSFERQRYWPANTASGTTELRDNRATIGLGVDFNYLKRTSKGRFLKFGLSIELLELGPAWTITENPSLTMRQRKQDAVFHHKAGLNLMSAYLGIPIWKKVKRNRRR